MTAEQLTLDAGLVFPPEPNYCAEMAGEQAKAEGMARADLATTFLWRDAADAAIARAAASGEVFQAADLPTRWGCPEPRHPNAWGARIGAAARAGVIRAVGYGQSNRPTTARSAVRLWQGVS